MTLTIATRWQVTFRVQPLAPVTLPRPLRRGQRADGLAIAQARQLHAELAAERFGWEKEAMMCFRRMY